MGRLKKAFTLIELLVAISILAILSTLVLANLNSARERGRDVRRKSDLQQVRTALRLYYNDHQEYPDGDEFAFGDEWSETGTVYMNEVPQDPLFSAGTDYSYVYSKTNDDSYTLKACLENKNDESAEDEAEADWCPTGKMYKIKQD